MDVTSDDVLELIDLAYAAAHHPRKWPAFLGRFAELNRHAVAVLAFSRGSTDTVQGVYASPGMEEVVCRYNESFAHRDPFVEFVRELPDGRFVKSSCEVLRPDELVRTSFYDEYLRPFDLGTGCCGVEKDKRTGITSLSLYNAHLEPTDDDQLAVLRTVMPHALRSLSLFREFARLQFRQEKLCSALEIADCGFITLNRSGDVQWHNRYAAELLEREDGICWNGSGVQATESTSNKRLKQAIRAALAIEDDQASGAPDMLCVARDGRRPLEVIVTPLGPLEMEPLEPRRGALVTVCDPDRTPSRFADSLQRLHGLSPTESAVVEILTEGLTAAEIASALNISIHTVRTHLRNAFAKTRTRSQAELVALTTRGAATVEPLGAAQVE